MKNFSLKKSFLALAVASTMTLTACGGGSSSSSETPVEKADFSAFHKAPPITITNAPSVTDGYNFDSKFEQGKSSIKYTGQVARHALISDMADKFKAYEDGTFTAEQIDADMSVYFEKEPSADEVKYVLSKITKKAAGKPLIPGDTYGSISEGKNLIGKLAGNDKAEHITGSFTPWLGAENPTDVVYKLIDLLKSNVASTEDKVIPTLGGDAVITEKYITNDGRNLNQLVQKYLLMSVAFNQGASDYLRTGFADMDHGTADKNGTKPYTTAEHKWDEGFGYFGASRDYNKLSDADIKSKIVSDTNNDGKIDLTSEVNQGAAVNCAKRDAGSAANPNPTDFTKQAFDAFVTGRSLLNDAANTGSKVDEVKIVAAADQAAYVWEQCVAATVVHYINDTNGDLAEFIANNGKFENVDAYKNMAKHWSEMKGFAIGLQFNKKSPFHSSADANIAYNYMITNLMGEKPEFGNVKEAKAYQAKLEEAKVLLQNAYNFDATNVANW